MTRLLRMADVCRELGRSADCIRDWVRRGHLAAQKGPSGQLQFDADEVEALKTGRPIAPEAASGAPRLTAEVRPEASGQRRHWTDMPPWRQSVEQTRAAVEIDHLEHQLDASQAARDHEARLHESEARAAAAAEAEYQRVAMLKRNAKVVTYVPAEVEATFTRALNEFVTPAQVPAWLGEFEQTRLVHDWARRWVRAWQEAERQKDDSRRRESWAKAAAEVDKAIKGVLEAGKRRSAPPRQPGAPLAAPDARTASRAARRVARMGQNEA